MEPRWEGDTGQLGIPVAKSPSGGRAEWREHPTVKISLIVPAGALSLSQGRGGDEMLQAELGDTLCPIFMFRDLRARPPSHSQGEAPARTPDLGSSERHQERWGGVDELPGAWPRFHRRTGTGDGEVGNGAEQSIVSKANQQSSKGGNQQD